MANCLLGWSQRTTILAEERAALAPLHSAAMSIIKRKKRGVNTRNGEKRQLAKGFFVEKGITFLTGDLKEKTSWKYQKNGEISIEIPKKAEYNIIPCVKN